MGILDEAIGKAHYQGYRTHKLEWLRSIDLLDGNVLQVGAKTTPRGGSFEDIIVDCKLLLHWQ